MPEPRNPRTHPPSQGQSPSQSQSQSDDAEHSAGSSKDSAKGSPADASAAFLSDPGPGFDAAGEPGPEPEQAPAALHALPGLEPEWEEDALARLLLAKGELLHTFAGVAENDWRYMAPDLKAIAPPLARILNRVPAARAAAVGQDPLALAIATSAYMIRSGKERAVALRALREEMVDEPITGAAAPAGAEPPPGHPLHEAPAQADEFEWQKD